MPAQSQSLDYGSLQLLTVYLNTTQYVLFIYITLICIDWQLRHMGVQVCYVYDE